MHGANLKLKYTGTGSSSYKKRIYRPAFSQRLRNTDIGAQKSQQRHWWCVQSYAIINTAERKTCRPKYPQ